MTLLSLALREVWNSRRRVGFPILSFALAVASLIALRAADFQVERFFATEGQKQLGGDLSVEALRPLAQTEVDDIVQILGEGVVSTAVTDFNTMLQVQATQKNQFVRAFAISSPYPLIGAYQLEPSDLSLSDLDRSEAAVVLPKDLAQSLDLKMGDEILIGEGRFKVAAFILKAPGSVVQGFRFAPRIFFHQRHLESTGLLSRPGRVDYERLFKIPGVDLAKVRELKQAVVEKLNDRSVRVTTYDEANRGFQRVFDQVRRFAELIGLAAILIVSFALLGTFRAWFFERRSLIALLRTMGAQRHQILVFLVSALAMPLVVGGLLGVVLGYFSQHLLFPVLKNFLEVSEFIPLSTPKILQALGFCFVIPVAVGLNAVFSALRYRPIILIKSDEVDPISWRAIFGSAIALYFILAALMVAVLDSWKFGLIFPLGLLFALQMGSQLSYWLLASLRKINFSASIMWIYALRSLVREALSTRVHLALVFLVSFIFSILFVIEAGLRDEFKVEESVRESSLFAFDIGEDEKTRISTFLSDEPNLGLIWAPWVRIQWTGVNDKRLEDIIGEDERFEREMFVSESVDLPLRNEIVKGEFWSKPYTGGEVEISLAKDYARFRGIKLGDRLNFELFGVPFKGHVTSFRRIRWTEFEPNFRILFQGGFFQGVPFNFLGAIQTNSNEQRLSVAKDMARAFPGISVLDVSGIKNDLVALTEKLSFLLKIIVSFLVVLGLGLMAALSYEKVIRRLSEIATLKCLGATSQHLLQLFTFELLTLSLVPSVLGGLSGLGIGHWILQSYLNLDGFFLPWEAVSLMVALPLLMLVAGILSLRPALSVKPRVLFADH